MENVVVLVADSLRYDYVPERIEEDAESDVIPTLAPSLHTPTSFASLFTAREANNHRVHDFMEELDPDVRTAFDHFENTSFYDGPGSSINKHIFRSESEELGEVEEPFIWIERLLDTHLPYGRIGHEREFDLDESGKEYVQRVVEEGTLEREYEKGTEALEAHFHRHIEELEERGLLDDTLVVLTSDHGELLGERFLLRRRYEHNYPPLRPLVEVPTVFHNSEVDTDAMRLVDVIPTALGIAGKETDLGDGVDVRDRSVREGRNLMEDVKAEFDTTWRFDGEHWRPTFGSRLEIGLKTFIGDLKRFGYRKGYRPLEQKLEERKEERGGNEEDLEGVDV
ncbi:MAG: sulfatase-like hydrolase/transferase [Candidatus Nanohaloarchaea archaeon]|nr:sulfatase-like hydrolase/transferase [Candidatus Nanohaloarchaea archaeon]